MRYLYIALLSLQLSLQTAAAQGFALRGNEFWAYNRWETQALYPGGCFVNTWRFYELRGDTMINGQRWYRLFSSEHKVIDCTFPTSHNESYQWLSPAGYLRDEGAVWYYIATGTSAPVQLFSFDIPSGTPFWPGATCSVDTVTLSDEPLPRRILSQIPPQGNGLATQIVEGIGATHSYFFPECYACFSSECAHAVNLVCFKQHGQPVYWGADCATAEQEYQKILDVQKDQKERSGTSSAAFRIEMTPNPARERAHVSAPAPWDAEPLHLEVWDAMGRRVYETEFAGNTEIELAGWLSGVYTVRIRNARTGHEALLRLLKG